MKRLKIEQDGFELYSAGLPHFPRNFTRDSILSAILLGDSEMLSNQLSFCASKQGKVKNPLTGEEPGKIFHEYPGVRINGRSTGYNACDTTALFLMGHEIYQKLTEDVSVVRQQQINIERASKYILSHLKKGFFIEDPRFAAAEDFALKVTYWKDYAGIVGREDGKPKYPITYTLAHIQNMRALRSAAKLLSSDELMMCAEEMAENLQELYDNELRTFYTAVDSQGPIKGISSDSLHALFYLNQDDLSREKLEQIVLSSEILETPMGYRTFSPQLVDNIKDQHQDVIWPFEQAMIHMGAEKFNLSHVAEISSRVLPYLDTNPETFILYENGKVEKQGNDPQLWTIAAKQYFENEKDNKRVFP